MKKLFFILVFILIMPLSISANATDYDEIYKQEYDNLGLEELEGLLPDEYSEFTDKFKIDIEDYHSFENITAGNIFTLIADIFKGGLKNPFLILSTIIVIIIISSTLKSVEPNETVLGSTNETLSAVIVSFVMISPAFYIFNTAVSSIKTAATFCAGFIPVFTGVMAASGKTVTSSLTSGTLLLAAQIVEQISAFVILPFLTVYLSVGTASVFYDKINFSIGAASIKKLITFFMTTVMMVFSGVISLQNLIGTASDSISLRTAKYIAGSTPIIGGAVSEAVGLVTTCLLMMKNSVIIYAVISFSAILLPVIIESLIWRFCMYIAQTVASVFGMNKIASLTETVGYSFSIIISVTITTFIMFVISLTVVAMFGGSI